MSSPRRFSAHLSWTRIAGILFLPFTWSGFVPRADSRKGLLFGEAQSQPHRDRFNWSHLSPSELKNRTLGLQRESTAESNGHFTLEGHRFLIFGGSIHYFRVPRAYWRDRLLKLRACGFNTVTTYVPWNLHEPQRGTFDFSGNLDLEAFVLTAAEVGLWVILRPGPYICSEVDLGGLPSWLLQDPELRLRTADKGFVEAVDKYFDHLIARVVPLQELMFVHCPKGSPLSWMSTPLEGGGIPSFLYHRGGPIIAVQVENEYGSFDIDEEYMPYLRKVLLTRGIVEMLLTSDNEKALLAGHIKGVLATINVDSFRKDAFRSLYEVQGNEPIMVMEYWVGWFDTWGGEHTVKDASDIEKTVSEFINFDISFNIYMFHGGTNFGFINGATYFEVHRSVVTSYDYDAVLTEAGDYTEKYFKLRKLLGSVLATPLPPLPELTPKAVYPVVRPSQYLPLWDVLQYLDKPVISNIPVNMENLPIHNGSGQSYGFILYETSICSGGQLSAKVQDTAQVFLNEKSVGILDGENQRLNIPRVRECQRLRILVENQGRVNFSWKIQTEQKGLTGPVTVNNISLEGFTIYSLEMHSSFFERLRSAAWRPAPPSSLGPAFYLGTLKVGSMPKDTFLRLPNWNYGFVFVNGHNLGRYWSIGPQQTLYLPGAWLHPEDNEIILFERSKSGSHIQTTDKPKL